MASTEQIQKIKSLAKNGESVNTIKEKLEIPKSTVYYHFKKEVGQKQKEKALKIPENPEIKGEICGIFAGDGYVYVRGDGHYEITITLNIRDNYWKQLSKFFEDKLQKKAQIVKEEKYGRVRLRYSSKKLYDLFQENLNWSKEDKTGTICLNETEHSHEFKIGFIRGLIDTDGSKDKEYRIYRYGSISESLVKNFCEILDSLEIENSVHRSKDKRENCRDMFRVKIYSDNADKFSEVISPRHSKKQF